MKIQKAKLVTHLQTTKRIHQMYDRFQEVRLNKYISECGVASRRASDTLIEQGRIKVNGKVAIVGMKIQAHDVVTFDHQVIKPQQTKVYLVLNKPVGIVTTTNQNIKNNIIDFLGYQEKVFPIGRLDKHTSGLILFTNDGDIVNKILKVEYGHEKEYIVKVDQKLTKSFIDQMEKGVEIYNPVSHQNQITLPTKVKPIDETSFYLTIQQGLNRQIRRMAESLGFKVVELKRIRIMHIQLG